MAPEVKMVIHSQEELLVARSMIEELASSMGFGRTSVLELILALIEVGGNLVRYAKTGRIVFESVTSTEGRRGIEIWVLDEGPGIANVDAALLDGYSTAGSRGLGLGAAQRLTDEFRIESEPGKGTRVRLLKWKPTV